MKEIWKDIPDWLDLYQASSLGRIRSLPRKCSNIIGGRGSKGGIVKPIVQKRKGYLVVNLTYKKVRKQEFVHRLILKAFRGIPSKEFQACHNDGNKVNNNIKNLRWDTLQNNIADRALHGTNCGGEKNGNHKITDEQALFIKESNLTNTQLARIFKVSWNAISYTKKYRHKNSQDELIALTDEMLGKI